MRSKSVRGLKLSNTGGRNFVFVPTPSAQDLRAYLQTKGFQPLQPQEMSSEASSLELSPKNDPKAVQAALDQWGRPSPEAQSSAEPTLSVTLNTVPEVSGHSSPPERQRRKSAPPV